ncbi:hypothetical protein IDG86_02460 [Pelagibacterales bacterium SAG-MED13]|nr:hypothetical protein [Pelagibacterales bacterium SAG-MED13]
MRKIIFRVLILTLLVFFSFIVYLSTIGINTNKLNSQISEKIKNIHQDLEIKLKKVNIILDPFNFRLKVKTSGAIIKNGSKNLNVENIKSNISIKSLIDSQFYLTDLFISTKSLEIKKLISFVRLVHDKPQFFITEKFIDTANLTADIYLEFDEKGNVKKNFVVNGYVNDGSLRSIKKIKFSKINFIFSLNQNELSFKDVNFLFNNKKLVFPDVKAFKKKNNFFVSGKNIIKKISLADNEIKDLLNFTQLKIPIKDIEFEAKNVFSFSINNSLKIKDLKINSELNLIKLDVLNGLDLKKLLPNVQNNINFINHKISVGLINKSFKVKGEGNLKIQNEIDKIQYELNKSTKDFNFNFLIEMSKNPLILDLLNYQKGTNSDLKISVVGNKKLTDDDIIFKDISLTEKDNFFNFKKLYLNKEYKIQSVEKIQLNFVDKDNLKNVLTLNKQKQNYILKGESFNANKIINDLLKTTKSDKKNLFKDSFKVNIDINKTFLDKNSIINNLNGYLLFKDDEIKDAILNSNFSKNEKIVLTIKSTENGKITTLYTDVAKPLVNRYEFIKGFEEGNLDFYSIKKNGVSKSTLIIDNFKVQEVPALAKLLTLASLQGIADLLTGEGIRFSDFEIKFLNNGNLMKIEELYAIGPAISIMMDGYVESNELISLRGTLVPATTINRTISSIPLIGKILVGNKTGEGVFGVSFKVKGHPKDLKTSVNPVKTLTPRFITRTLEKIKKN